MCIFIAEKIVLFSGRLDPHSIPFELFLHSILEPFHTPWCRNPFRLAVQANIRPRVPRDVPQFTEKAEKVCRREGGTGRGGEGGSSWTRSGGKVPEIIIITPH